MHSGSCLCGIIAFTVSAALKPPDACHCSQCRKQSGHYWASTDVQRRDLVIRGEQNIRWFQSSAKVRRGFCGSCGSVLFWDPLHRDTIAIAMGAFDAPTCTELHMHIFTADKGDYYSISDGLVQE